MRRLRGSGHLAARCRDQFVVGVRGTPQTPAAVGSSLGEQHPYPRRRRWVSRCARDQGREPLNEGDLLVAIEGTSVGQDLNPPGQLVLSANAPAGAYTSIIGTAVLLFSSPYIFAPRKPGIRVLGPTTAHSLTQRCDGAIIPQSFTQTGD